MCRRSVAWKAKFMKLLNNTIYIPEKQIEIAQKKRFPMIHGFKFPGLTCTGHTLAGGSRTFCARTPSNPRATATGDRAVEALRLGVGHPSSFEVPYN